MAYVTQRFGCAGGGSCGCSSCGCRSRLGEWYVPEDDDDDERPAAAAKPAQRPVASRAAPRIGWLGEPPITAPAQGPDTIERICRRGSELIQHPDHFGVRIPPEQRDRIRCILSRLCQPGFDDRFLTPQGVLNYYNRYDLSPQYIRAKPWLLPDYAARSGTLRTDQDILQTLVGIDDTILSGRVKIKSYWGTHGAAMPLRLQQLRDWVLNQQNNRHSIYWCYRP
jgi:hypothetical protein